ncbi:hypothetical protein B0J11DRAFT_440288 [Dendryphion nanum]|uniref:DUF1917-domain-containing protein n=1 Tax=Dendryphion nanum TaxID=256645 RepID=A0A9P9IFU2_9PLEO|nr:hypothetical protein B0J11DRAFT_440288 [Dendryphion nanum]
MPTPSDLHNIYQGRPDSWQLEESVNDFIRRLPPHTSKLADVGPWIWVANPHREGHDKSGQQRIHDVLIPHGRDILQNAISERNRIRTQNASHGMGAVTELLNQQSEQLKQNLADLAGWANVLAGKWMLFPTNKDLVHVWQLIVDGIINNRLGSAAKVATDNGSGDTRLICVYTTDFRDTADVARVLKELDSMGLVPCGRGIFYKSDAYTYLDIYGKNASDYGLQASMYSSQMMLK